jgi:hypothetical protein
MVCSSRTVRAIRTRSSTPRDHPAIAEREVPMFGICLGHQLLGSRSARDREDAVRHRGGNHPVREIETGRILITSQNHGFAVKGTEEAIPGAPALEVTHVNLNDGTVEGLKHRELPCSRSSTIRRPHRGRTTPDRCSNNSWKRCESGGAEVLQALDTQELTRISSISFHLPSAARFEAHP